MFVQSNLVIVVVEFGGLTREELLYADLVVLSYSRVSACLSESSISFFRHVFWEQGSIKSATQLISNVDVRETFLPKCAWDRKICIIVISYDLD